ncbi:hypothetical protein G7070_08400 [Propioniciclava coleopterorum]|uniref:Uncharacterized protein n=1 Tax=Propioniciclava coleopterorum TaxID=2714937 RepID=A0A6G7Y2F2_9ACTN|nr:hypothetical protein [Propioniciclava coleopterorum]QIK70953.1 hypothetical protein G7070_08400 [Propioniciclava coleopterorum]
MTGLLPRDCDATAPVPGAASPRPADAWARGGHGLFERVTNLVRVHAPGAAIAFNATPEDTWEAAARWVW